mmetsp:Transcript_47146/g.106267  ORF Transcript_47146/g.106267 Transcript_47146/m.106267 type:complete len:243 (-) Transcript_47146:194-922(-)
MASGSSSQRTRRSPSWRRRRGGTQPNRSPSSSSLLPLSGARRRETTATTSLRFAFALTRSTRPISQTRSKMAGYGRRIAAQEARLIRCDRDGEHSLYCLQRARCPLRACCGWLVRVRSVRSIRVLVRSIRRPVVCNATTTAIRSACCSVMIAAGQQTAYWCDPTLPRFDTIAGREMRCGKSGIACCSGPVEGICINLGATDFVERVEPHVWEDVWEMRRGVKIVSAVRRVCVRVCVRACVRA